MGTVTHLAADGGRVVIGGPVDLSKPSTSVFVASFGGRKHEFTTGPFAFGQSVAAEFAVALDEEYSFQGGRLRLGSAVQVFPPDGFEYLLHLGVWEGTSWSLETGFYEGDLSYMIALFDQFTILERTHGLVVGPKDPAITPIDEGRALQPRLLKVVPGLGLLEVQQRTSDVEGGLPNWVGSSVAGGELFRDGERFGRHWFILVGETAVTVIDPDQVPEQSLLSRLSAVTVSWDATT
ncbi:MAG: hypothetical protein ACREA0_02135 [bacterium]